jgi:hypothetical protein
MKLARGGSRRTGRGAGRSGAQGRTGLEEGRGWRGLREALGE